MILGKVEAYVSPLLNSTPEQLVYQLGCRGNPYLSTTCAAACGFTGVCTRMRVYSHDSGSVILQVIRGPVGVSARTPGEVPGRAAARGGAVGEVLGIQRAVFPSQVASILYAVPDSLMTNSLMTLALAASVPLLIWWLARCFPAPELSESGRSLLELGREFRLIDLAFTIGNAVVAVAIAGILFMLLHWVALWRAYLMQNEPTALVFFTDGIALWLPAFFLGLVLSIYALIPIKKAVLKARYSDYQRYQALVSGAIKRK